MSSDEDEQVEDGASDNEKTETELCAYLRTFKNVDSEGNDLSFYYTIFVEEGVESIADLEDVDEDDLVDMGVDALEAYNIGKIFADVQNVERRKESTANQPSSDEEQEEEEEEEKEEEEEEEEEDNGELGGLLGRLWGLLAVPGASCVSRGASWGLLGVSWEPLGGLLGASWGLLGPSWGALGALLGAFGALLGPSWRRSIKEGGRSN